MTTETIGAGQTQGEDLLLEVNSLKMHFPVNAGHYISKRSGQY